MKIRPATVHDAPAMGRVIVETFLASNQGILSARALQQRAQEWTPEISARNWAMAIHAIEEGEQPHSCIFVAEDNNGELIGLAMGAISGDEAEGEIIGEVYALYVSEKSQRQGTGRALVQATAAQLARWGMTKLQIATQAANDAGRYFYERLGGHVVGTRTIDEAGDELELVVYEWADLQSIAGNL